MESKRGSRSRRREEAWSRWGEHLKAQRASGQTQAAYCRAQGLDARYFAVWKRKLAAAGLAGLGTPAKRSLRLVPLVVKAAPQIKGSVASVQMLAAERISIQLTLRNGLSVSLTVPSLCGVPELLGEPGQLPC